MPIGFDPNETCEVMLNCIDRDKPALNRAVFTVRFLTSGQVRMIARLREQAAKCEDDIDRDELLNQAIRLAVVGWRGLRGPDGQALEYGAAGLDEFTPRLKFFMVDELPTRVFCAEADRGNSSPHSLSASESSARASAGAAAAAEPAGTNQP